MSEISEGREAGEIQEGEKLDKARGDVDFDYEFTDDMEVDTSEDGDVASIPASWDKVEQVGEVDGDVKAVNPQYDATSENEWSNNCQRCAPAYEMRRRGYDVGAEPSIENGYDDLKYCPEAVWEDPEVQAATGSGKQDIEQKMSEWGDGSRAEIVTYWKEGGGHAFSAEQVDGETRFVDAQTGDMDASWYFDRNVDGSTRFWRTDDIEPSDRIMDCCKERDDD